MVAGEHSGDFLGLRLMQSLKQHGFTRFIGTGGNQMEREGLELIYHVDEMAVMGFTEGLLAYRRLKKMAQNIVDICEKRKVKLAVLIDYPGFNIRLAGMLKKHGIVCVQVVSPQIWAWKFGRIHTIKKNIDMVLTLFEFEAELYREYGTEAHWIGHPWVTAIPDNLKKDKPIPHSDGITVGLLPGSREGEIRRLLRIQLDAAKLISEKLGNVRFLVPGINEKMNDFIKETIIQYPDLNAEFFEGRSLRVMQASDLVILASGTATMEASYLLKPMIIVYKVGILNFLLGGLLLRTRFIGMPNILARRQVALELIQSEVTAENIAAEALRILENDTVRQSIVSELRYVKNCYGTEDPAEKAGQFIRSFAERL